MNKLISELKRLYGGASDGQTRSMCLGFTRLKDDGEAGHWDRLCAVANALQADLGLPAPAVSISGAGAYGLWLSLEKPVPAAQAQEFMELVRAAYCPEMKAAADLGSAPVVLPPGLNHVSGKWAAFIHPGMGASFAGDEGLEMQPPEAGQLGLLEGLKSIDAAQFAHALAQLRPFASSVPQPAPAGGVAPEGLLLKDATLEEIVSFLHSKNIEPTFRFMK
ncbi:hypothetical protein [Pseudoduganella violaceinigra]|uniref:hypothetical protein n=1 Tax=Pseudoduganella violaceinigra TaxID=246602 RepID=UPI000424A66F|nr:hypothetical protein [Pseudoduganella violaceinigra]